MFFYSNINQESLKTRVLINEFMKTHYWQYQIQIEEVDYDREIIVSQQYGVTGTPALLFLKNRKLIRRHFGEITAEEFKSIIYKED
jgi:thioredoxin-related protein